MIGFARSYEAWGEGGLVVPVLTIGGRRHFLKAAPDCYLRVQVTRCAVPEKKKPGRKARASALNGTSGLLAPKFPARAYTVGIGIVAKRAFDSKRELRHEVPARRETE